MENMDKELTVPKWVIINQPKIPQMPQKISAQFVCPSSKVWDFRKKVSEVHVPFNLTNSPRGHTLITLARFWLFLTN